MSAPAKRSLTDAECIAGISRNALDVINRKNGARSSGATPLVEVAPSMPTPKEWAAPEKTNVVDAWNRTIDIINVNNWNFAVRELVLLSDRPAATHLYLNRVELQKLSDVILKVLAESPGGRS